jgi:hypothetical protein
VSLQTGELTSLADIADRQARKHYAPYLHGSAKDDFHLREHTRFVSSTPAPGEPPIGKRIKDWVTSRMKKPDGGGPIVDSYNVLPGGEGEPGRDWELFAQVRDVIIAQQSARLDVILRFAPGFHLGGESWIQANLVAEPGEDAATTRRRGRWESLGTLTHEMMHALAHPDFGAAADKLANRDVVVEGLAEYFARPLYNSLVERSRSDDALRLSIEGAAGPKLTPPEPTSYGGYIKALETLKQKWLGNKTDADEDTGMRPEMVKAREKGIEESLRVAFFMGKVEFLGLGSKWSGADARAHHSTWVKSAFPGNTLSGAIALDAGNSGAYQVRVRYGRLLAGRAGPLKFDLGLGMTYLGPGEATSARVGGSVDVGLRYEWPNLYIGALAGVGVSGAVAPPKGQGMAPDAASAGDSKVRLDILPGLEAGVRIGIVNLGVSGTLLVPVGAQTAEEKKPRPLVGVGASVAF